MPHKNTPHRNILMPPERRDRINETARRMGVSGEELIGYAIDSYLNRVNRRVVKECGIS